MNKKQRKFWIAILAMFLIAMFFLFGYRLSYKKDVERLTPESAVIK